MPYLMLRTLLVLACLFVVFSSVGCIVSPEVREELSQYKKELLDLAEREQIIMKAFRDGSITLAECKGELKLLWELKDRVQSSYDKLRSQGVGVKDIMLGFGEVLIGALLGFLGVNKYRNRAHPTDIKLADLQ